MNRLARTMEYGEMGTWMNGLRQIMSQKVEKLLDDPRSYYLIPPAVFGSAAYLGTDNWQIGLNTSVILGLAMVVLIILSSDRERSK